jgi:hypothetical protein
MTEVLDAEQRAERRVFNVGVTYRKPEGTYQFRFRTSENTQNKT